MALVACALRNEATFAAFKGILEARGVPMEEIARLEGCELADAKGSVVTIQRLTLQGKSSV